VSSPAVIAGSVKSCLYERNLTWGEVCNSLFYSLTYVFKSCQDGVGHTCKHTCWAVGRGAFPVCVPSPTSHTAQILLHFRVIPGDDVQTDTRTPHYNLRQNSFAVGMPTLQALN
jgi:hypothetical protein